MLKKLIPLLFIAVGSAGAQGQSFYLPVPDGWRIESLPFPIEFATQIPYSGAEHLRFSPGWGDTKSEELWSYCFLWWIEPDSKISKESLERDLKAYYSGLVGRNIVSRKIDSTLVVPTITEFKELVRRTPDSFGEKAKEGTTTYAGTVKMLDYMSLRPVTLHVEVRVMPCLKEGKSAAFFAVSPQPKTHAIWKQFGVVRDGFRCTK
jgi:hypothetical protein